ncbi:MAG: AsmA family protein [Burkholderiales bacterium]
MKNAVKYALLIVAILLLLLIGAAAYLAATFDPNDYKPQVISLVKDKTGRTLQIGDIKLTFFPTLGVDVANASLSEKDSTQEFAKVASAHVALETLPLLKQQFVVDDVALKGLAASVVRFKDGSMNIDDLIAPKKEEAEAPKQPFQFDIDSVDIEDANLSYRDEQSGAQYQLSKLDLETGHVALGVETSIELSVVTTANQPKLNLATDLKTRITMGEKQIRIADLDLTTKGEAAGLQDLVLKVEGNADADPQKKEYALSKLDLNLTGQLGADKIALDVNAPQLKLTQAEIAGEKIAVKGSLSGAQGNAKVDLAVPSVKGNAKSFETGPIVLNVNFQRGADALDAKLNAPLAGTMQEDGLIPAVLTSTALALEFAGTFDKKDVKGSLRTPMTIEVKSQAIDLPKLVLALTAAGESLPNKKVAMDFSGSANVNESKETVKLDLSGKLDESNIKGRFGIAGFAQPAITFDADIDRLNVDRYTAKEAAGEKKAAETTKAAEQPLDFSALKNVNANGSLRIGNLTANNIKAQNVKVTLKAKDGNVEVAPVSAQLYDGTLNGAMTLNAAAAPRISLKQTLTGINVGPLLKDVIEKDTLQGKGNVSLDVRGAGQFVSGIKRSLDGTAVVDLKDGALKGINIAQSIRDVKAKFGVLKGETAAASNESQKTDFSELHASFVIKNGVAHNEDLSMKSPLIRLTGAGDINIGNDSLDYLAKATVVATTKGQGGAELEALKGVTVPVKISGPFADPKYALDFSGVATQAATQKVKEKLEEKILGKPGEGQPATQDKVKDVLKGIFGK